MSNRKFSITDWNKRHFNQVEQYAHRLEVIYQSAVRDAALIAADLALKPRKVFEFDDYPQVKEQVKALLQKLAAQIIVTIYSGQKAQWEFANAKNDAFVGYVLGKTSLSRAAVKRYNARNLEALAAFQTRKVAGLTISDRVFNYTSQFKREIEFALDVGLGEGRSTNQLSQDLRGYLQEPDKLFHRVRNKRGNLVLSKPGSLYHPGQGVYRSSYKNAQRLARTEINSAYRESDRLRWNALDFVVGIEVKRSNNPYPCDVCDSLKGIYPKTYVFRGNHSNCRCYAVSILATPAELSKLNQMLFRDEEPSNFTSVNEVTDINPGYLEWVEKNKEKLLKAKSLPSFVGDNLGKIPQLDFLKR
ncbi:hypothetical protein GO755_26470 [Spirosoma sp. HMF4905]|uniref:Phage head morphogenesis domain-containing protein n=1 Tax=Spirosoma arboris TaxID=2682092 RepID=A0A7K1SIF8_9BACT|nr:hypothetical protein [Spirosoma arboris]MVM33611.1 hypothetical protein [Spirosoma arboris]